MIAAKVKYTMETAPWQVRWYLLESGNPNLSDYTKAKMQEIVRDYSNYFSWNSQYEKRKVLKNLFNKKTA